MLLPELMRAGMEDAQVAIPVAGCESTPPSPVWVGCSGDGGGAVLTRFFGADGARSYRNLARVVRRGERAGGAAITLPLSVLLGWLLTRFFEKPLGALILRCAGVEKTKRSGAGAIQNQELPAVA